MAIVDIHFDRPSSTGNDQSMPEGLAQHVQFMWGKPPVDRQQGDQLPSTPAPVKGVGSDDPSFIIPDATKRFGTGDQLPSTPDAIKRGNGDQLPSTPAPVKGVGSDDQSSIIPDATKRFGNKQYPMSFDDPTQQGDLSPDQIKHAVREVNHLTTGMVEPGKESIALRGANEGLLNGDLKKFSDAFKGLSTEERQDVVDAMNQAFDKRGSNTRINVDGSGNLIVSNGQAGEETSAAKVNPDTGNVTEVKGRRDGNDFVVAGESTSSDGETVFKGVGEATAKDLMPDIPTIKVPRKLNPV